MDPHQHFASLFRAEGDLERRRAKFLSRVFGIFYEEIVRIWAAHSACPYEDLGRPTTRRTGLQGFSTLDFMLRHRTSGECFATELKCEVEYENFRYLTLTDIKQLDHHKKPAFAALLDLAKGSPGMDVQVGMCTQPASITAAKQPRPTLVVEERHCRDPETKGSRLIFLFPDTRAMCPSAQMRTPNSRIVAQLLRTQCLIDTSELPKNFVRRPDKRCSPRETRGDAA